MFLQKKCSWNVPVIYYFGVGEVIYRWVVLEIKLATCIPPIKVTFRICFQNDHRSGSPFNYFGGKGYGGGISPGYIRESAEQNFSPIPIQSFFS